MFMAFPDTYIHPFIGDAEIQLNVYAWIHLVHLQLIAQIMMNVHDSQPDEIADNKIYLAFMLYDWIDFAVTCNQPYCHIGNIPVTANILSLVGFILVSSVKIEKSRYVNL